MNTKPIGPPEDGRIRYTAACNEEGVVIDDGIIVRLGPDDYYFTSSTGRGPSLVSWYARFKEKGWQAHLVDLTDSWAGMNLAGPKSRDILARLTLADVSGSALPFMGWAAMDLAGVACRIFRMGFLGELSYEIHCPANQAPYLWTRILAEGEDLGAVPAGLETQLICRLEKGHVLPGMDADGNTTLFEAGFGWLWDRGQGRHRGRPHAQAAGKGAAPQHVHQVRPGRPAWGSSTDTWWSREPSGWGMSRRCGTARSWIRPSAWPWWSRTGISGPAARWASGWTAGRWRPGMWKGPFMTPRGKG